MDQEDQQLWDHLTQRNEDAISQMSLKNRNQLLQTPSIKNKRGQIRCQSQMEMQRTLEQSTKLQTSMAETSKDFNSIKVDQSLQSQSFKPS